MKNAILRLFGKIYDSGNSTVRMVRGGVSSSLIPKAGQAETIYQAYLLIGSTKQSRLRRKPEL